jgi:hypothetical protein
MRSEELDQPRVAAGATPRRRGCLRLGCIAKTGLGCGSFALGALVVVLVLLPATIGSVLGAKVVSDFKRTHEGALEIGKTRFAWFEPQIVDGLTLRDPDGAYVGTARLRMPSLADGFRAAQHRTSARIRVDLDADLKEDEGGVLNLERALALREPDGPRGNQSAGTARIEGLDFELELGVWRAAWSSAAIRATGRRHVVLVLDEGALTIPETGIGRLAARGTIEDDRAAHERRPLSVELEFLDLERVLARRERPRAWSWTVDGLSADLLAAIGPAPEAAIPYAAAFGERVASVRVARLNEPGEVYELELRGAGVRLDLVGAVRDGALRGRDESGGARDAARVDFALDGFWRDAVVLRLLPFLSDLRPSQELAVALLEVTAYALPLDGAFEDVTADVRLDLGEVTYRAFPAGVDGVAWPGFANAAPTRMPPVRLHLEGGRATLAPLRLAVGEETLELSGAIDPASGTVDLRAIASPALAALVLESPVEGAGPVTLYATGSAADGFRFARAE